MSDRTQQISASEQKSAPAVTSEFLTPESMLTPGICGALTMMITNAFAQQFGMERSWFGLAVSAMFGMLVFTSAKSAVPKFVYFLLNTAIIFSVAFGANGIGATVTMPRPPASVGSWIGTAWAGEPTSGTMRNDAAVVAVRRQLVDVCSQIETTSHDNAAYDAINVECLRAVARSAEPGATVDQIEKDTSAIVTRFEEALRRDIAKMRFELDRTRRQIGKGPIPPTSDGDLAANGGSSGSFFGPWRF